jgi:hypothetical protein
MYKQNASKKQTSKAADTDWAERELANAPLSDQRLVKRLITLTTDFALNPTAPIPQACGSGAKTKAAYRFFDNNTIAPEDILASHVQATLTRMRAQRFVLCPQDTSALNYSTHPQTQGLGPISNNRDKTIGMFLHATLALTPEGQPLGVLDAQTWVRSARHYGRSSCARNNAPIKEKESQKWIHSLSVCQALAEECPQTTLVNMADREGDLYDLFQQALEPTEGPRVHLIVRAQHNRQVEHPQKYLLDFLAAQPVGAHIKIQAPRKDGKPERMASLSVRWAKVTLRPPCLKEKLPSLTLWAVEARETRPPEGCEPIVWRLLTTLPVEDAEAALEKIRWYSQRWQIEVIHKILKSGCKVEQRQLETAARLKRALMVDLIVAWRVLALCKAARETPEAPASDWLSDTEWRALSCYMNKRSDPPKRPPSVAQAVRWIAQLGGFLGRRSDGDPGPTVLWRGLQQLRAIAAAWTRFGHE